MSKSEDNESLDFQLSEKPEKKLGSMEHAGDETQQRRRQARGLKNQPCTVVLRGLHHFGAEAVLVCACSFCLHWVSAGMKKGTIFFKSYPSAERADCFRSISRPPRACVCTYSAPREETAVNFSRRSSHVAWRDHGTSTRLLSREKRRRSAGITRILL